MQRVWRDAVGRCDRAEAKPTARARRRADRLLLGVGVGARARTDVSGDHRAAERGARGAADHAPALRGERRRSQSPLTETSISARVKRDGATARVRTVFRLFAGKSLSASGSFRGSLCYSSVHHSSTPRRAASAQYRGVSTSSEDRWRTTTAPQGARKKNIVTTPRTSPSSRASRLFASVRACTSARPGPGACTTSSTRSSTTLLTRLSPAIAMTSRSRSTPTTRSRSSTTAAASRSRSWRRSSAQRSRSCSPSCTPAASSATAADTRSQAGCTVSACRSSTRCPSASTSKSGATVTSGRRRYERGRPQYDLKQGEPTSETGTTITFLPDADVFETLDLDFTTLEERMRETAFLTAGLRIMIVDERGDGHRAEFQYEGGIVDFVALPEREQGADPQEGDLVLGGERRGRRRGGDAVELLLSGVGVLVRQQHQHASRAARTSAASARR